MGATGYAVTIDREHLHVVARDGHLVHGAARAAAVEYGRVSAEIALAVTGTPADVDHKRAAILAHASQVGPDDVPQETFAAAYGYEWYRRTGAPGVLDHLGNAHLVAVLTRRPTRRRPPPDADALARTPVGTFVSAVAPSTSRTATFGLMNVATRGRPGT